MDRLHPVDAKMSINAAAAYTEFCIGGDQLGHQYGQLGGHNLGDLLVITVLNVTHCSLNMTKYRF